MLSILHFAEPGSERQKPRRKLVILIKGKPKGLSFKLDFGVLSRKGPYAGLYSGKTLPIGTCKIFRADYLVRWKGDEVCPLPSSHDLSNSLCRILAASLSKSDGEGDEFGGQPRVGSHYPPEGPKQVSSMSLGQAVEPLPGQGQHFSRMEGHGLVNRWGCLDFSGVWTLALNAAGYTMSGCGKDVT